MLKLKNLIVVFILFGCSVFAQNLWTNEIMINFTIQSNTKAASCVDANGIHIVYFRNGGIKYALVNSQGGIIKYDKVIEAEGSGADFANVAVVDGNIYAIYYKNNDIKVAKSTNLGDSWNNTYSYYDCVNTGCNKVIAYSDVSNIHITWSEFRTGSGYYTDVHYVKFTPSVPSWSDYKRVSDITTQWTEGGENPDLVLSTGKVFVNYIGNTYTYPVNRDKSFNNPWNNPEDIPFDKLPMTNLVTSVKPLIIGNELNTVYVNYWAGSISGVLISHSYKNISGTSWTQNQAYLNTDWIEANTIYPNVSASTANGKIHLIYWDKDLSLFSYRQINNHSFSGNIANISLVGHLSNVLVANSNDLYLLKTGNVDIPGKIYFRHYDDAPLAPANLNLINYNGHPKLQWSANREPDFYRYTLYRDLNGGQGFQPLVTTSNLNYIDNTVDITPPGGPAGHEVNYGVTAKDIGSHESDYSNMVSCNVPGQNPQKIIGQVSVEYKLAQNYPNPFNPTTAISYGLEKDGLVTLKVFDMLGREVAELVNENQPEGYYKVEFNAADLPSGIYFYQLKTGKYTAIKKMLLIK